MATMTLGSTFPLPKVAAMSVRSTLVASAALAFALTGCRTTDIRQSYELHAQGNFEAAADDVAARIANQSGFKTEDTLWLLLEEGKMLQDAGRWQESNNAFEKVRTILDNKGDQAFISINSIGNDIGAMQTDDRQMDYVGTLYDRILIHTAMAVNYAMLGDLESAAANVRAQTKAQQTAVALNQKRIDGIDRRRGEDQGKKSGVQGNSFVPSFTDFEATSGMKDEMKRMMGLSGDGYSDYHAPYGYVLGAILLGAAGRDGEQQALAQLASDPKLNVQFKDAGKPVTDDVIVLFENGIAPVRLDASFMYLGPNGPTKVPVPKIELRRDGRAARLRIDSGGNATETQFADSVDGIVVTDFRNALPIVWFRAMMQVMIKEMETYLGRVAARNSQKNQDNANLAEFGVLMAGAVARNVVSPDLRTWETLPGEHQIARLPRPQSNQLNLSLMGSGGQRGASTVVQLPSVSGPVIVFVRSTNFMNIRAYAQPLVHGAPRS